MAKTKTKTISGETPGFETKDILVSRTDHRGVILAANKMFQSVSGYDWSKLHKAPHKMIRHPDMPKGVFWLFWDALKRKQPIGAFVKNKSKQGTYYWVFACASPQGKGYMSIRIKPTEETVSTIAEIYAAALRREQDEGLSPAESGLAVLADIKDLGFRNYTHFMAQMALQLTAARDEALDHPPHQLAIDMTHLTQLWGSVRIECDKVFHAHELISHTPNNLSVQAAHLNDRGIPLSVIASNFTILASEISEMISEFGLQAERVEERLNKGAFLVCTEHLMKEVVEIFQSETVKMEGIDRDREIRAMTKQRTKSFDKTVRALTKVRKEIEAFANVLEETSRVLSGLSVAKVMCEIENTYVSDNSLSSVTDIIAELDSFQEDTRASLFAIREHLFDIDRTINLVLGLIAGVEAEAA